MIDWIVHNTYIVIISPDNASAENGAVVSKEFLLATYLLLKINYPICLIFKAFQQNVADKIRSWKLMLHDLCASELFPNSNTDISMVPLYPIPDILGVCEIGCDVCGVAGTSWNKSIS